MLIRHFFFNTKRLARRQLFHRRYSCTRNLTNMVPCCLSPTPMRTLVWTEDPGILRTTALFSKDRDSTLQVCGHSALSSRVWCAGETYMARPLQQILGGSQSHDATRVINGHITIAVLLIRMEVRTHALTVHTSTRSGNWTALVTPAQRKITVQLRAHHQEWEEALTTRLTRLHSRIRPNYPRTLRPHAQPHRGKTLDEGKDQEEQDVEPARTALLLRHPVAKNTHRPTRQHTQLAFANALD